MNVRIASGRDPLVGEVTTIDEVEGMPGKQQYMNIGHLVQVIQHHLYHQDPLAGFESLGFDLHSTKIIDEDYGSQSNTTHQFSQ